MTAHPDFTQEVGRNESRPNHRNSRNKGHREWVCELTGGDASEARAGLERDVVRVGRKGGAVNGKELRQALDELLRITRSRPSPGNPILVAAQVVLEARIAEVCPSPNAASVHFTEE